MIAVHYIWIRRQSSSTQWGLRRLCLHCPVSVTYIKQRNMVILSSNLYCTPTHLCLILHSNICLDSCTSWRMLLLMRTPLEPFSSTTVYSQLQWLVIIVKYLWSGRHVQQLSSRMVTNGNAPIAELARVQKVSVMAPSSTTKDLLLYNSWNSYASSVLKRPTLHISVNGQDWTKTLYLITETCWISSSLNTCWTKRTHHKYNLVDLEK